MCRQRPEWTARLRPTEREPTHSSTAAEPCSVECAGWATEQARAEGICLNLISAPISHAMALEASRSKPRARRSHSRGGARLCKS